MDARRALGNEGEKMAEAMLLKKGYTIVARQFRTRFGEIDLIADDRGEVVFIEVKTRRKSVFGYPEESVSYSKLRKMQKTAEVYLSRQRSEPAYRFDIVAIEYGISPPMVTHFINIELRS